jgi:hypothetical protein
MKIQALRQGSPWVAFVFCSILSVMTLCVAVLRSDIGGFIPFLSFLPMCFFFSAACIVDLQKQVRNLQCRLDEHERK